MNYSRRNVELIAAYNAAEYVTRFRELADTPKLDVSPNPESNSNQHRETHKCSLARFQLACPLTVHEVLHHSRDLVQFSYLRDHVCEPRTKCIAEYIYNV